MGLMSWLRGVGGGEADRPGGGASEPGSVPGSVAGSVTGFGGGAGAGADRRAGRVDVDRLEPMRRLVSGQRLTSAPAEFEASLTTRQDTALGTPLGHLVSPDAPAGLVRGIGVAEPAPSSPAPSSPVAAQRSVDMPLRGDARPSGRAGPPAGSAGGAEARDQPVVREAGPAPVQRLYGGEGPAMTSAAEYGAGAGGAEQWPVRRLVGERTVVPDTRPAVPDLTPAEARDAPTAQGAGPVSGGPGLQRAVTPPAGDAGKRTRRTPGLGAPLPGLPPTAQRRAATDGPAPGGPASRGAGAEGAGAEGIAGTEGLGGAGGFAGADEGAGGRDAVAPLLGEDPVAGVAFRGPAASGGSGEADRSGDAGGVGDAGGAVVDVPRGGGAEGAGGDSGVAGAGGVGGSVQRTLSVTAFPAAPGPDPEPARRPVAPLLGDRPLVPRNADVQRAVEPGPGPAPGPDDGSAVPPGGVPVRWTGADEGGPPAGPGVRLGPAPGPAGVPSAPGPLQRRAVGAAGGPPIPASVARSVGPGASGAGRGAAGPPGPPPPWSGGGAGAVAVSAGVAQRMADGSVVFAGAPVSGTSRAVVQRAAEPVEPVEEPPPPEPADEPPPEPVPVTEPGGGEQPGPAAAAGQGGGGTPAVTDELVRALYPPLSRLLKNDLRLERERAGHLINTRH
ncbi:hypothetical protein HXS80_17855 [Streptomyces sp. CB04723]|uniref:hypothetical protein n=1 Tax=Streptomyces TaxID=1883 RepID=UPI0015C41814|nr:hypothetical protein [Streptomyces sp. CB04723]QLG33342.1 hypothetical protein HXS80_17855 [Streptomyces sp. CB04723]